MPRSIRVAAIQMDGRPMQREARFDRATALIAEAQQQGADLIVLPSVFNTGKTFFETNYEVTERLSDATLQWLCEQSQQHDVYLAATWMIVDKDDTYNAAFLVSPDGEQWRYDQRYPQLWERVFYRDGMSITVADTELGKIGFMIGWDVAHPDLWERYAAKVDLMLVFQSDIDFGQAQLQYQDGSEVYADDFGYLAQWLIKDTDGYLAQDVVTQSHWMNVPTVVAGASGQFESIFPAPFFSIQGLLLGQSDLWQQADGQYADMMLSAPFVRCTQISNTNGDVIASIAESGDAVLVSDLVITDRPPLPLDEPQPEMNTSEMSRFVIDGISSALMTLTYRRGVRRQWGARMAPMDNRTRVWLQVLFIVSLISAMLGRWFIPKRR